jgi:hypothetical protein
MQYDVKTIRLITESSYARCDDHTLICENCFMPV